MVGEHELKKSSLKYREGIADARRVVIKIGSRVLVQKNGRPDGRRINRIIKDIAAIRHAGHEVAVVTSGAVGAGMAALKMKSRPSKLPEVQMAAAVGQTRLMSYYAEGFGQAGLLVGQILLTHGDFQNKVRQSNARRTAETLLRRGVIPIINENDVVTDEELRADLAFGDNDYLASLVVKLIRADLLIILSTVDGLREHDAQGRSRRVRYLDVINRKVFRMVQQEGNALSKGGMTSKLKAARSVAESGCGVVIANGLQKDVLPAVMAGEDVGTFVVASAV